MKAQLQKSMIKLLSLADCISLINAILGFLSIIMVCIGEIRIAFSLILLAILADGLDGIIARKIRGSKIGEYVDSIADMISFGIAPSIFIYFIYYDIVKVDIYENIILTVTIIIFLITVIIRLASFHIIKQRKVFIGMPSPACALVIIILSYFEIPLIYLILILLFVSFAMISNIRFPKPDYKIDGIAGILIILTIIMGKNFQAVMPLLLLIAISIYVIIGPIYLLINKKIVQNI